MVGVEFYEDKNGRKPYKDWFQKLDAAAARKAADAVYRMEAGHTAGLKSLGKGLAEWRIDWGPGLRLYVHQDGPDLILLMGGSDKGDQAAQIAAAAALVAEHKQRKKLAAMATAAAKTLRDKSAQVATKPKKKRT